MSKGRLLIFSAPSGSGKSTIVNWLMKEHPDIQLYIGNIDRELNENKYICPGLGDCGDRIYGTK